MKPLQTEEFDMLQELLQRALHNQQLNLSAATIDDDEETYSGDSATLNQATLIEHGECVYGTDAGEDNTPDDAEILEFGGFIRSGEIMRHELTIYVREFELNFISGKL